MGLNKQEKLYYCQKIIFVKGQNYNTTYVWSWVPVALRGLDPAVAFLHEERMNEIS